jgi:hypothetical protein
MSRSVLRIFFVSAIVLPVLLVELLMAQHHRPMRGQAFAAAKAQNWRMTHIMVAECPCSQAVVAHLARRGAMRDAEETVLVAGTSSAAGPIVAKLQVAGYTAVSLPLAELRERTGIAGGPWLVVHDPDGQVRYSGGYAAQRPAASVPDSTYEDADILQRLRAGETVKPLIALGCSVNPDFADLVSP